MCCVVPASDIRVIQFTPYGNISKVKKMWLTPVLCVPALLILLHLYIKLKVLSLDCVPTVIIINIIQALHHAQI